MLGLCLEMRRAQGGVAVTARRKGGSAQLRLHSPPSVFTTINKVAQHAQDTQCPFLFTCTHLLALSRFIDK
jgi:hypothetical protein